RRRHTRFSRDWSSDVCSSDLCLMTEIRKAGLQMQRLRIVDRTADLPGLQFLEDVIAQAASHPNAVLVPHMLAVREGNRGLNQVRSEERRVGKERRDGCGQEA